MSTIIAFAKSVRLSNILLEYAVLSFIAAISLLIVGYASTIAYMPFTIASAGESDIVMYSAGSTLVYTGLIPSAVNDVLLNASATIRTSPEVTVIVILSEEVVLARGVEPTYFKELTHPQLFGELDRGAAFIGIKLAEKLNINLGEWIYVYSVFNNRSLALRIEGFIEGNQVLEDEVLIHIDDARFLRGIGSDAVSYIRVRASSSIDIDLVESIANATSEVKHGFTVPSWLLPMLLRHNLTSTSISRVVLRGEDAAAIARYTSMTGFAAALLLTLLLALTTSAASTTALKEPLRTLYINGFSKQWLITRLLLVKLALSTAACITGLIVSILLGCSGVMGVELLSHRVPYGLDLSLCITYASLTISSYIAVFIHYARRIFIEE
ncbi:MAG: hypothetical protein RMI83_00590 [Desulfurococcaceae archaeon]|nr:hypothetical protein [Sulfolobales archaeon]MDW8169595.1 hypothetical protein [Desulfurococcaceae archaeon]